VDGSSSSARIDCRGARAVTGATKSLLEIVRTPKADPRDALARLGIGFTPAAMTGAAAAGDARAVGLLLDAGMPVDAGSDPALPPLMLAAKAGSLATVKRLLEAGADPTWTGAEGSPLTYAVRYRRSNIVAVILEKPLPQATIVDAFVLAGEMGDLPCIALLAPHVHDKRSAAQTALHGLVENTSGGTRAASTISALAVYKPDPNALDGNRQSLLHIAVNDDVLPVLTALLKLGANPDVRGRCHTSPDRPLVTPLACAAVRGTSEGLASAKALIAARADIDARGPGGQTPLMAAAANGDAGITAVLLDAGANPLARDAAGKSPMDYAQVARYNDPRATISLLRMRSH